MQLFSVLLFLFPFFLYFCAVKLLIQHRRGVAYLLVAMMIVAAASRLHLNHAREFYRFDCDFEQTASSDHSSVRCNCPICHAEDVTAVETDPIEYHTLLTTLSYEFGVYPTASANDIVTSSSLRGPPSLS